MNIGAIAMWLILIGILGLETWGFVDMPPNSSANAILLSVFRAAFWVFAWIAAFSGNQFARKVMGALLLLGAVFWLAIATDTRSEVSTIRAYSQTAVCCAAGLSLLFLPHIQQYTTARFRRASK